MKTVVGHWSIDLWLQCPYCGEYVIDSDIEDGQKFHGKVKCDKCSKTFIAEIDEV